MRAAGPPPRVPPSGSLWGCRGALIGVRPAPPPAAAPPTPSATAARRGLAKTASSLLGRRPTSARALHSSIRTVMEGTVTLLERVESVGGAQGAQLGDQARLDRHRHRLGSHRVLPGGEVTRAVAARVVVELMEGALDAQHEAGLVALGREVRVAVDRADGPA